MDRRQLLDHEDHWVGWARTDAGVSSGWHHHGDRDSYIYMLRGSITIEYGPGGREAVTVSAGDFIFNPARMVHREITRREGIRLRRIAWPVHQWLSWPSSSSRSAPRISSSIRSFGSPPE